MGTREIAMTGREWTAFDATMVAEGNFELAGLSTEEVTEDVVISAWQHLIDTGLAWSLQGSFGRTAHRLIEAGICHA